MGIACTMVCIIRIPTMARATSTSGLSLAQLERLMRTRRSEMTRLGRKRDKLQKQLDAVDSQMASISGGAGGGGGGGGSRARNKISLQEAILQVLSKSSGPMNVGAIMEKVSGMGYRSTSANFRGIVNQTLIKDKRFTSAARGMYQLKK
jgi:hypothetical protein